MLNYNMNTRQKTLLEKLHKLGRLSIEEEALIFNVVPMTVRRDIQLFERQGIAIRTHGGAVPRISEPTQLFTHSDASEVQKRIARKAVEMIPSESTVLLSTGSTTLEVARQLAASDLRICVITNSLPIAAVLFQTKIQVILTGGSLRTTSLDLVGPVTEKNLDEYYIDLLITGCDGASAEYGFFTKDLNLAEMEKKSVKKSGKTIIVTESTKFNKPSFVKFASLNEVTTVITDKKLPDDTASLITKTGIELIQV